MLTPVMLLLLPSPQCVCEYCTTTWHKLTLFLTRCTFVANDKNTGLCTARKKRSAVTKVLTVTPEAPLNLLALANSENDVSSLGAAADGARTGGSQQRAAVTC